MLVPALTAEQSRARYPDGGRLRVSRSLRTEVAAGDGRITMVTVDGVPRLWHFYMRNNGWWYLERLK